ncbi:MAG: hypothetical protein GXY82_02055 [Methanospirillum sp.]|nr:hypothetical protein [Methanospirillum sp.]
MLVEAFRESFGHPEVWLAGVIFGALDAIQLMLSFQGETFISVRLRVLVYLVLPFLLAGAYGVLGARQSSVRLFAAEGVRHYFRVLLPGLVVGFGVLLLALVLILAIAIGGTAVSPGLLSVASAAVLIPVAFVFFLYDTAAVIESLGVFASLRRSATLVLACPGRVVASVIMILFALLSAGLLVSLGWTLLFFDRLEPLASISVEEAASFTIPDLAGMVGPEGVALLIVLYGLFVVFAFVLVASCKARLFEDLANKAPPEPEGVYDEKGRYYRY